MSNSDNGVSDRSKDERIEELENTVEFMERHINMLEEVLIGELGISAASAIVEEYGSVVEWLDADTGVRKDQAIDRSALLPIHSMWYDLQNGREDSIPNASVRRGARLFDHLFKRAGGESWPKVDITDAYYVMDSNQAKDILRAADDITDGGVSKTARRAMEAVQRFTKVTDCDCKDIAVCDHGLVIFDGSGGTNKLRVEKAKLNAYGSNVQRAISADDDGEQPSEADTTAGASETAEAADAEFTALAQAEQVGEGVSDTVVSNVESKASEPPIIPDD